MNPAFEVVFQDEYIVILNKIAKILTVPTPKKEKNTLTAILAAELKQLVFPCHRLDRETTGLIIYALSRYIEEKVFEQFRRGGVSKRYIAFVEGHLRPNKGIFQGKIIDYEGRRFGEVPKSAKAFYKVIRYCAGFCVVELTPVTGRTNQLRIQLSQAGHPILGEDKYAFRRDFSVKFKRLALHACYLSFRHPVSGDFVELKIGLPEDMKNFLQMGDLI
jgi:23S rRNA pseudouridine1911/1915/1917 synthase